MHHRSAVGWPQAGTQPRGAQINGVKIKGVTLKPPRFNGYFQVKPASTQHHQTLTLQLPKPQKQKGQPLRGQPLVVPRPPCERGGVIGLGC